MPVTLRRPARARLAAVRLAPSRPGPCRLVLAAAALALAGCSGGGGSATAPTSAPAATTTTTEGEPVVLAQVPALELDEGQCWDAAPAGEGPPTTAEGGGPPTAIVLLVDCAGPHEGRAYAAACLVGGPGGEPEPAACPGQPEDPWPGDRQVRRAAVRLCLDRFEEAFGEPYATSARTTTELVPTAGDWAAGRHRVVCTAAPPPPPAADDPAAQGA